MAASDYIYSGVMQYLLAALTRPNRLVMEVVLATGCRISDVLELRSETVLESRTGRLAILERKTGKRRTVRIPAALLVQLQDIAGRKWVFEGRHDPQKHRTRQAVYKDLKRAAKLFRLPARLQVSPHSGRKIYAVSRYAARPDIRRAADILNHGSDDIALLYAMADAITLRHHPDLAQYILPPEQHGAAYKLTGGPTS